MTFIKASWGKMIIPSKADNHVRGNNHLSSLFIDCLKAIQATISEHKMTSHALRQTQRLLAAFGIISTGSYNK